MIRRAMIPRVVIGGVSSGVGKTTLTVGLIRALRQRGLTVAAFKCGPDYLDPTYLSRAAGRPSHNLDGWMMGREAVVGTFTSAARGADVAIIEGVMGLFDGASPTSDDGSTAQIAKWLDAPVLLAIDAGGMARSVAALARGFVEFDPELRVAALACNRVGSAGHLELLRRAVAAPPIVGGLEKRPALAFAERHLGLQTAAAEAVPEEQLDAWGKEVAASFELDALLAIARSAPPLGELDASEARAAGAERRCRIGVAFDAAFHFYYEDNLRRLERLGAELVYFSPLEAEALPDVDGLYIGGGYPEVHAERLEANAALRRDIQRFAAAGRPIYAECGGLMYLCEAIRTLDGTRRDMVGWLAGEAVVRPRLVALGYVEVETLAPSLLGPPGQRFRGHQFRYSELQQGDASQAERDVQRHYEVRKRRGGEVFLEGYARGNVLASYVHAHWASSPALAEHFVRSCADRSRT